MVDSEILEPIKALQTKLDSQTVAVHHMLQQYMITVDSRLEDLRFHIKGSLSVPTNGRSNSPPLPQISDGSSGTYDFNPLLRTMKLKVPKFDGTDLDGWAFRINEYFDFHGTSEALRLCIVFCHLECCASTWYQWIKANDFLTTSNHTPMSAPAFNPPLHAPSTLHPILPTPSLLVKCLSPQELREKKK